MIVSISTLVLGFVIGYLGQRSRLCFIAGYRDWFLSRDSELLKGTLGAFVGALGGFILFQFLGGSVPAFPSLLNTPNLTASSAWLFAVVGGLGVGIVGVLSGGCPFRMHVLAAEGKKSNWYYLAGFYVGLVFFNLATVPAMSAIASAAPQLAVVPEPGLIPLSSLAGVNPTATPATSSAPTVASPIAATAVPTPMSTADYILSAIPRCEGIQVRDKPVEFAWPNIEQRMKELEKSYWGYYSCPQSPATVSAFYREQMPRPPYNKDETNWVDRPEGTLGVYYNDASQIWIYMWVVPQPADASSSYVIVALTSLKAFDPVCMAPADGRQC